MTRTIGEVFGLIYPATELVGLVAITVILHRLRFGRATVFAPLACVVLLSLALQVMAVAVWPGLPLFGFGLLNAARPAMAIVPPLFLLWVALSPRLSRAAATAE